MSLIAGDALAQSENIAERCQPRDPNTLTVPRRPVTRQVYVDLVRPMAQGFEAGPDRGQYGPRHALPALAVFALDGDAKLGEGIKKTLRHYGDWVHESVRKDNGVFSMEGATLCSFFFRELRKRSLMTPEDERFARDLLLTLRQYQCAWRSGDGLWRGSHHRSQCQGINHALAARFYPDEPDAAKWKSYADQVWTDWWDFRDVGINDTGYFYSSFGNILRASELLGRTEVFTDPQSRQLFERIMWEVTPDGASVPYGASGGYNSGAGARIFALELAARYTRDGRYRWVAHRLMNCGQSRGFSSTHHHLQAVALEDIALTSLICDDSVAPVEPASNSQLLLRKEILRLTDKQAKDMFPEAGGVDCNMLMSQAIMPHKLVFRAGWNPGDLFMLLECYPRHDPLNPTAIVGLERYSASFAEMTSEKFVSRENALQITDLSGTATFLGQKTFKGEKNLPVGWAGMETTVPVFSDHALATHALVRVSKYMGFEATQQRELLFVKNRFVLLRDETEFDDSFHGAVGPVWNTQHVGQPRGENWLNTWFTAHYFQIARLYDVPPWDLLIYHGPKTGAKLIVAESPVDTPAQSRVTATRYTWEGEVKPGLRLQFVQVLWPHAPTLDASSLAKTIETLVDEPGLAAVTIADGTHTELAILNPDGRKLDLDTKSVGRLATDARAVYLDFVNGKLNRELVRQGTHLVLGTQESFRSPERKDVEAIGAQ
ncbi:MAG: hypothetical protein NTY19_23880 [Planctomycetota bacterium]|nr:hypothetical protein [Planctomycetota bacterium]